VNSKFSGNGLFSDKKDPASQRGAGSFLSGKGQGIKTHAVED